MKQGTNSKGWPKKPWTIVAQPYHNSRGIAHRYYAWNMVTFYRGPLRDSIEAAQRDIDNEYIYRGEGPYAEPWGV